MKKIIATLTIALMSLTTFAEDNTFMDYQNYNHGYCPDCNCSPCSCESHPQGSCEEECGTASAPCEDPCDPCAPVCGTECGISVCAIGVGIAAVVAAAAIILSSGSGTGSTNT